MRSAIHQRSHLAQGPKTQVVEYKEPYTTVHQRVLRIYTTCAISMRCIFLGDSRHVEYNCTMLRKRKNGM